MIGESLSILGQLNETQRAISEHFTKGGSWVGILIIAILLTGMVALAYYLSTRSGRSEAAAQHADPEKLFIDLLRKLELTPDQQQRFAMLAGDLSMEHPAVMLLDGRILDRTVQRWREAHPPNEADDREMTEFVEQVKPRLFPHTDRADP